MVKVRDGRKVVKEREYCSRWCGEMGILHPQLFVQCILVVSIITSNHTSLTHTLPGIQTRGPDTSEGEK